MHRSWKFKLVFKFSSSLAKVTTKFLNAAPKFCQVYSINLSSTLQCCRWNRIEPIWELVKFCGIWTCHVLKNVLPANVTTHQKLNYTCSYVVNSLGKDKRMLIILILFIFWFVKKYLQTENSPAVGFLENKTNNILQILKIDIKM